MNKLTPGEIEAVKNLPGYPSVDTHEYHIFLLGYRLGHTDGYNESTNDTRAGMY